MVLSRRVGIIAGRILITCGRRIFGAAGRPAGGWPALIVECPSTNVWTQERSWFQSWRGSADRHAVATTTTTAAIAERWLHKALGLFSCFGWCLRCLGFHVLSRLAWCKNCCWWSSWEGDNCGCSGEIHLDEAECGSGRIWYWLIDWCVSCCFSDFMATTTTPFLAFFILCWLIPPRSRIIWIFFPQLVPACLRGAGRSRIDLP